MASDQVILAQVVTVQLESPLEVVSGLLEPNLETHNPKRLHNQDSGLGSAGYTCQGQR